MNTVAEGKIFELLPADINAFTTAARNCRKILDLIFLNASFIHNNLMNWKFKNSKNGIHSISYCSNQMRWKSIKITMCRLQKILFFSLNELCSIGLKNLRSINIILLHTFSETDVKWAVCRKCKHETALTIILSTEPTNLSSA